MKDPSEAVAAEWEEVDDAGWAEVEVAGGVAAAGAEGGGRPGRRLAPLRRAGTAAATTCRCWVPSDVLDRFDSV